MRIVRAVLALAVATTVIGCESRRAPEPSPMPSSPSVVTPKPPSATQAPLLRTRVVPAYENVTHLVVLMHGYGADAADLQPIARALSADLPHVEIVLPDGPEAGPGGGRQWFSLAEITPESRAARVAGVAPLVDAYVDAELARRGLGPDRLVVAGFSQGAIVAAWLATHREHTPAAVAMLSGRFADDGATRAIAIPAFVGHGARDQVIPVAESVVSAAALAKLGAKVERKVYPALEHGIGTEELRDLVAFLRVVTRS